MLWLIMSKQRPQIALYQKGATRNLGLDSDKVADAQSLGI